MYIDGGSKRLYCACVRRLLFVLLPLSIFSSNAHAALITVEFSGVIGNNSTQIFNAGDTFSGSYTFESTAASRAETTTDTLDVISSAIDPGLAGTGWELSVSSSSAFGNYSITGTRGQIATGNDTRVSGTFFGDRYVLSLFGAGATPLPGGVGLNFFQFDLSDRTTPANMLTANGFQALPNLALASGNSGRFFTIGTTGCSQCFISLTALTSDSAVPPVPVPAAVWLFASALVAIAGLNRRRRHGYSRVCIWGPAT